MKTLQELRTALDGLKGQQRALERQREQAIARQQEAAQAALECEEAQVIIQTVARETQDQLRIPLEDMANLAMAAVFDNPYTMRVEFPTRRNRTECDILFSRGGRDIKDLEFSGGGGAVDVAAFGLQMAMFALLRSHVRPILIYDEPLRWLKGGDYPERGALMISELARELGLIVLMVSHIPEQKVGADRLFHLRLAKEEGWEVTRLRVEDRK